MQDETMGPSPDEMGLSEKDRQAAGLQPENKDAQDPRKQIEDLGKRLRAHYRGQWETGAPEDRDERTRILDREITEYSDLTGFPAEDKRRLESLAADRARTDRWSAKAIVSWQLSHQREIALHTELWKAEKAAIEQKLSGA